jgi:Flp pilus assembly protein TadD
MMDIGTREVERLPGSVGIWAPRWSPDGKYAVAPDRKLHLYLFDMAAHKQTLALAASEWLYHYLLGLSSRRSGRLEEARQSLEIAVRLNPSGADVHNALGEVALREGDAHRAIASFQRAAELDPHQTEYRLNLEAARNAAVQKP